MVPCPHCTVGRQVGRNGPIGRGEARFECLVAIASTGGAVAGLAAAFINGFSQGQTGGIGVLHEEVGYQVPALALRQRGTIRRHLSRGYTAGNRVKPIRRAAGAGNRHVIEGAQGLIECNDLGTQAFVCLAVAILAEMGIQLATVGGVWQQVGATGNSGLRWGC